MFGAQTNRLKRLPVTGELLVEMSKGSRMDIIHLRIAENPLPEDTKVCYALTGDRGIVELIIESSEFEEVPEGALIPFLEKMPGFEKIHEVV